MLKQLIKRLLHRSGYVIFNASRHYGSDGLYTFHEARFRGSEEFQASYKRGVMASNGVDPDFEWRVHVALWAAQQALHARGDYVECGVNAGFLSSAIMHHLEWNKIERSFHLIDTFVGPDFDQYSVDEHKRGRVLIAKRAIAAGSYVTDMRRIQRNFAEWDNAVIVQGAVPDILPTLEIKEVAFLHLDMNCAYPESAALEYFWPYMPQGGVVLLDDYAYCGHEAQGEALDATAQKIGASVLTLPTGQGLIIK